MNTKQQIFINEYLLCWNATRAAENAGYKHPNKQGPRLLVKVGIAAEIQSRLSEMTLSANEVLVRLAEQARGTQGQYITEKGAVDIARLVADGKAHLIKSIKPTKYGDDIEFYDAQAALVHIGKHLQLFNDRLELSGKNGEPIKIVVKLKEDD